MAVFRDMEEVSQGLLGLLNPNRAGARIRRLLGRQEWMIEKLLDTKKNTQRVLSEDHDFRDVMPHASELDLSEGSTSNTVL